MLELMHGNQSAMDNYLPQDREIDDDLLDGDSTGSRSENQSGLDSFY